jgi:hypothetical protein
MTVVESVGALLGFVASFETCICLFSATTGYIILFLIIRALLLFFIHGSFCRERRESAMVASQGHFSVIFRVTSRNHAENSHKTNGGAT